MRKREIELRKGLPSLFVVPGGVSSQLEYLSRQIFHHGGEIDRRTGADAFRVIAFPEKTVDPPHGELQPGPAAAGLRLPLGLTWKKTRANVVVVVVVVGAAKAPRDPLPGFFFFFSSPFLYLTLLTAFAASRHVLPLSRARLLFPYPREEQGGEGARDR